MYNDLILKMTCDGKKPTSINILGFSSCVEKQARFIITYYHLKLCIVNLICQYTSWISTMNHVVDTSKRDDLIHLIYELKQILLEGEGMLQIDSFVYLLVCRNTGSVFIPNIYVLLAAECTNLTE